MSKLPFYLSPRTISRLRAIPYRFNAMGARSASPFIGALSRSHPFAALRD